MVDLYNGDMDITKLAVIFSLVIVLPAQLLLCFRVKNIVIRLLPVILFFAAAVRLSHLSLTSSGINVPAYIMLAAFSAIMFLLCGICWGTWAIVSIIREKDQDSGEETSDEIQN